MPDIHFVHGGPVKFDSPVYIVRKKDELALRSIRSKEFVSIIGPRQVGKTSLLQRIQAVVETNYDYASTLIDLSTINDPNFEFSEWAFHFCNLLINQLQPFINGELNIDYPKASVEFREYWKMLFRALNKSSLLILLDEANSVPLQVNDPFYSTIRSIYTDRNSYRPDPDLSKINFAFAGVFEPEKLVKNRQNSPFNVSQIIRLTDFSRQEIKLFANQLEKHIDRDIPGEVLDRIYFWTNGHPYLTQTYFAVLQTKLVEQDTNELSSALVDNLIPEIMELGSDNVDHTIKITLDNDEKKELIIDLLRGKIHGFSRANRLVAQLELDGVIKEDNNNKCIIRNAIYELALKRAIGLEDELILKNGMYLSRDQIFISYSHSDDSKYLDKLRTHLKPMERNHKISIWDDRSIKPGKEWKNEIQEAIDNAKVAILMVSANFIASDFIANSELPPILDAAADKDGITIIWLPVSSCAYEDTAIEKYQAVIDPQKPLDMMTEAELNQALLKVYRSIREALNL